MPLLTELLRAAGIAAGNAKDVAIESITADSRQVKPGSLFVALKGEKTDGKQFIGKAVEKGAAAVLSDSAVKAPVPVIVVNNPHQALAQLAAGFYGKQPEYIVAITGTDGKTSTADFTRQFWHRLGFSSAALGTIGVTLGNGRLLQDASHTTPDPVSLHHLLADMAKLGCTHLAMEASSHGLDQHRLDGVKLQAAAFTNLARDHMDYHQDEADYFAAKARLFSELLPRGTTAVLNADDKHFSQLKTVCASRSIKVVDFGHKAEALRIENITPHANGQEVSCRLLGASHTLNIPLVGAFQVYNIFAAFGLASAVGAKLEKLLPIIGKLHGVPGRLEHVTTLKNGAAVYIDYAHTPMAIENILRGLRPHTKNTLHIVFGCGGDRDAGKRPQMGKVAAKLADHVIVTDDNPRSENPAHIRQQIMAESFGAIEIAGRKEAITQALKALKSGDVLVIAGKGHEKTQTIGTEVLPFHDGKVALAAAKELGLLDA